MVYPIVRRLTLLVMFAATAAAHVGSPDIYLDGKAGPYQLFVTIRPPQVIPGVAELEVRCRSTGVSRIRAVPLPLSKSGSAFSPVPDVLKVSAQDSQFYNGSLWLMADGSSQVRLLVDGDEGSGVLAVPVPSVARTTRKMRWQLGAILSVFGVFLVCGLIAIAGASVREARLTPGAKPDPLRTRHGRVAMAMAFVIIAVILMGGKSWWDSEAKVYTGRIYKPLNMTATLDSSGPVALNLNLREPGWMRPQRAGVVQRILFIRKIDDLVPDHNHLMHLYAIRQPGLDVIYHLHPDLVNSAKFRVDLPTMPAGDFKLYADIVHENGLAETMTASISLPLGVSGSIGRPLTGDDASASTQPVEASSQSNTFKLPDGYQMKWIRDGSPLHARQGIQFRFQLLAPDGKAPQDMAFYMGMLGHAAFVKTDGTVFAHIHPNGTVAMAALTLAQSQAGSGMEQMPGMSQDAMMVDQNLPDEVSFPYGLPSAGRYRIFVQMKHGKTVETGIFDALAE